MRLMKGKKRTKKNEQIVFKLKFFFIVAVLFEQLLIRFKPDKPHLRPHPKWGLLVICRNFTRDKLWKPWSKSEGTAAKRKEYHRQNGTRSKQKTHNAVGIGEFIGLDPMLLLTRNNIKPDAGYIEQ